MNIVKTVFLDLITAAALMTTAAGLYIGISERQSGEMTFVCGFKPVYIVSGSMEPSIRKGALVLLEKADAESVAEGDIITFRAENGYVTHRLIGESADELSEDGRKLLITKGDANNVRDSRYLNPDDILGKTVWICNGAATVTGLLEKE